MNARTDKAELAQRLTALAANNALTNERDRAFIERDRLRVENKVLHASLRVAIKERDEARALGRRWDEIESAYPEFLERVR